MVASKPARHHSPVTLTLASALLFGLRIQAALDFAHHVQAISQRDQRRRHQVLAVLFVGG